MLKALQQHSFWIQLLLGTLEARYIVLFGGFSAITYEALKVRQVKQCKKGCREIFQMSPTDKYICI